MYANQSDKIDVDAKMNIAIFITDRSKTKRLPNAHNQGRVGLRTERSPLPVAALFSAKDQHCQKQKPPKVWG